MSKVFFSSLPLPFTEYTNPYLEPLQAGLTLAIQPANFYLRLTSCLLQPGSVSTCAGLPIVTADQSQVLNIDDTVEVDVG